MLPSNAKNKGAVSLVLVIVILLLINIVFFRLLFKGGNVKSKITELPKKILSYSPKPSPTPEPFAFQELTIPFLKTREYKSKLNDLELISENENYNTYLTSYDSDDLEINGLLTVPSGDAPKNGHPAIVFVHGYIPPTTYRTTEKYVDYVNFLAKNGFVVFKIDLRGHDKSEGDAFGAYYSGGYVVDTLNAHSALQVADFVNKDQVHLWGHSMAGNVVFRALAASPSVKKIVIWAGAVYTYDDFSEFSISDGSYQPPPQESARTQYRDELFDTYGRFDSGSEFWSQVPATNYLDDISAEIQIHHAVNDSVVSIDYSRNLLEVLEETNIKGRLYEYSSGGHNIESPSFTTAIQRTADFLKQ